MNIAITLLYLTAFLGLVALFVYGLVSLVRRLATQPPSNTNGEDPE